MSKSYADMTDKEAVDELRILINNYWGSPNPVFITPGQRTAIWIATNYLLKSIPTERTEEQNG